MVREFDLPFFDFPLLFVVFARFGMAPGPFPWPTRMNRHPFLLWGGEDQILKKGFAEATHDCIALMSMNSSLELPPPDPMMAQLFEAD